VTLSSALHEWHEFYVLLGTAAAALVALLFVAASIGVGFFTDERAAGTRAFISPIVAHFAAILLFSMLALTPFEQPLVFILPAGASAIVGFAISLVTTVRVTKAQGNDVVFFDRFAYGAIPLAVYAAIAVAALFAMKDMGWSLYLLAGALLVLLFVNIRNAWDLMLTIARRQSRERT
jgi:hypothetical protein